MTEQKFAGTIVTVDTATVGKVTAFNRAITVGEAEVTGSEDLVAGGDIVQQQFVSTQVGETATVEGVSLQGDEGQSELYEAASSGATVALKQTKADGSGVTLSGFFTAYAENGGLSAGIYTWSGTFRVNEKTPIVPTP